MPRTLRRTAPALLVASALLASLAPPAQALGRFGRPDEEGPSRPAERVERGSLVAFLLHLFDLARGTMDPNGGS